MKTSHMQHQREEIAARMLPYAYLEYCAGVREDEHPWHEGWREGVAGEAIRMADALLIELEKER